MRLLAVLALSFAALAGTALAGPLHDAARTGDGALMQQLLRDAADINEQDENGETALFAAARAGLYSVHDQLLVAGADSSIRDNHGLTVLHAAAMGGVANVVAGLIGEDYRTKRIEMDEHDNELGVTPLYVAAEANHANIVAYLATYGADKEIADKEGRTALTRAGQLGNDDVVTILLKLGAACQDIDATWKADCEARKAALK
jgi:ankyrin repeat protein